MKEYLYLTYFHLKRFFKSPKYLIFIILPVVTVAIMAFVMGTNDKQGSASFAIESQSPYFDNQIYPNLIQAHQIGIDAFAENEDRLKNKDITLIYQIPEDFEQTGQVIAKSLSGKTEDQYFQEDVRRQWLAAKKQAVFKKYGLVEQAVKAPEIIQIEDQTNLSLMMMLILFMIFYFMYMNSGVMSTDLLNMKVSQVLKRSLVSKSSNWTILGSLLTAYGFMLLVVNLLTIVVLAQVFKVDLANLTLITAFLLANIVFVLGFVMVTFRLFKSPQILQAVSMGSGISFTILPQIFKDVGLENLAMFSPFYWITRGLEYSAFWPNGFIVILMGLVLFTAGSMKLENLATSE